MWRTRLAREPTTVVRVRLLGEPGPTVIRWRWSWALVVVAPEVRHYPDVVEHVGRVQPFDWSPSGGTPSTRDAVREILRTRPVPT